MPHLSLMYGDQHSAEDKAAAAVAARQGGGYMSE